jgi:hypothetical protein
MMMILLPRQVATQDSEDRVTLLIEKLKAAIGNGDLSVVGAFADLVAPTLRRHSSRAGTPEQAEQLLETVQRSVHTELRSTLRFFFIKYDADLNGVIDQRCVLCAAVAMAGRRETVR